MVLSLSRRRWVGLSWLHLFELLLWLVLRIRLLPLVLHALNVPLPPTFGLGMSEAQRRSPSPEPSTYAPPLSSVAAVPVADNEGLPWSLDAATSLDLRETPPSPIVAEHLYLGAAVLLHQ